MKKILYFFSRHEPTKEQRKLAEKAHHTLVWCGDIDAFTSNISDELFTKMCGEINGFISVAVVNPMLALRFVGHPNVANVCVFENANRDGKFTPVALHEVDIQQLFNKRVYTKREGWKPCSVIAKVSVST